MLLSPVNVEATLLLSDYKFLLVENVLLIHPFAAEPTSPVLFKFDMGKSLVFGKF